MIVAPLIAAALLVGLWALRRHVVSVNFIPSSSMSPSILPGDLVIGRHTAGYRKNPARGATVFGCVPAKDILGIVTWLLGNIHDDHREKQRVA